MSQTFSREHRLLTAAHYRRVFANPSRASDAYFTVLAIANGEEQSRLGLAIAKKQLKRAVDRNRIKRLVREAFRTQVRAQAKIPADFVVMTRSAVRKVNNARLRASLSDCFDQVQEQLAAKPK